MILPLWLKDMAVIDGPNDIMWVFLVGGLTLSLVQAKGISPVNKWIGDYWMFVLGIALYILAFLLLPIMGGLQSLLGVVISWSIAGIGMAFFFTGMQTTVSKYAEAHERGAIMGAFSAFGLIGRVMGPLMVGTIYANIGSNSQFLYWLVFLLIALLVALNIREKVKTPQ